MDDVLTVTNILKECKAYGLNPQTFPKFKLIPIVLVKKARQILRQEEIKYRLSLLPYEVQETIDVCLRLKKAGIPLAESYVWQELPTELKVKALEFLAWVEEDYEKEKE